MDCVAIVHIGTVKFYAFYNFYIIINRCSITDPSALRYLISYIHARANTPFICFVFQNGTQQTKTKLAFHIFFHHHFYNVMIYIVIILCKINKKYISFIRSVFSIILV